MAGVTEFAVACHINNIFHSYTVSYHVISYERSRRDVLGHVLQAVDLCHEPVAFVYVADFGDNPPFA